MSSVWMMALVGAIYVGTTITLVMDSQPGKALMFTGYAIAQVGLIWDLLRTQ